MIGEAQSDSVPLMRSVGLAAGQQAPDGGPYRLLVVDDDQANRRLLIELPAEWVWAMHQALIIGDVARMAALVEQLPGPPQLLDELRKRVDQFEHETILKWIEGGKNEEIG